MESHQRFCDLVAGRTSSVRYSEMIKGARDSSLNYHFFGAGGFDCHPSNRKQKGGLLTAVREI